MLLAYKILNKADAEEQSRLGKKLLFDLLACAGISADGVEIIKDENGRPLVKDHSELDFNISHSPSLAVCVLSVGEGRVGVDTEPTKSTVTEERRERFAKRYFSENEINELGPCGEGFSKIWTRKEALLKRSGKGLNEISSTDTCALSDDLRFETLEIADNVVTVCLPRAADIVIV
jgi:4'-phosphopantetheinyl transferase